MGMNLNKVCTSSTYNYNGTFVTPSSSTEHKTYTFRLIATIPGTGVRSYSASSSTFCHKIYLNGTLIINNNGTGSIKTYSGHINVGDIIDLFVTASDVRGFLNSYFNPSWGGSNSFVGVGIDYEYQTIYIDTTANAPTWCCIKY